ncbi:hypothetical protein [Bosea sp. FBZP-16]|uniref:hypothetical protein n=1 Tax=Bosea sp. FBZP-16 TaxID=2065382 RepID=UPI000C30568B|nr:hypothetical protein [Bosea sp. FBZP-16]
MAQVDNAHNPRAVPGNNEPPNTKDHAWSTYRDVSGFLAETPVIQSEDTAREAKLFWDRAKISLDEMEEDRDSQVRPLNEQVKSINAGFKEVSGPLGKLKDELQSRMAAFALAEEKRKAAEAEALRVAAREAERVAREAEAREQEAIANASEGEFTDVGDAIGEANDAFADYKVTSLAAARAERDVKARIGGGLGRAFTLRTSEVLEVIDAPLVLAELIALGGAVPAKVADALLSAARDYRKLKGNLPRGVKVTNERG